MKETIYDEDCRKLTKLLENNSKRENKGGGHIYKMINLGRMYQRQTELSSN